MLTKFPPLALVNHGLPIIPIHLIGSISLSSPPVAGVWWPHWRCCAVAAVASSKWMLHTGGGWGETPYIIVKRFGCIAMHNKALYKCFIHSFIQYVDHVHSVSPHIQLSVRHHPASTPYQHSFHTLHLLSAWLHLHHLMTASLYYSWYCSTSAVKQCSSKSPRYGSALQPGASTPSRSGYVHMCDWDRALLFQSPELLLHHWDTADGRQQMDPETEEQHAAGGLDNWTKRALLENSSSKQYKKQKVCKMQIQRHIETSHKLMKEVCLNRPKHRRC